MSNLQRALEEALEMVQRDADRRDGRDPGPRRPRRPKPIKDGGGAGIDLHALFKIQKEARRLEDA